MLEYINNPSYDLSLGQKQRITIAGVLSIKPKIIILDEPTAMLDSEGKESIKNIIRRLKEKRFTIIYITNIIDEIFLSDRAIVLENGRVIKEFETKDILDNIDFLKEKGITIPKAVYTMKRLQERGIEIDLLDLI
ncbi:MAG: ATP-binding cassette domain-containing protein [Clostridia bacterium]|nr:ATP-binding cassette domain-containing protein [Clostridia bacterium]